MKLLNSADDSMAFEQSLIKTAVEGNAQSFILLVARYQDRVYRFILKHIGHIADAQDLAQDTFLDAYLGLSGFRGDSALSTWLLGIALNRVRNHLNRSPERRFNHVSDDLLGDHASLTTDPSIDFERRELLAVVRQGLDQLPAELREALIFVSLEQLSYQETAALLAIPTGTAKSRVNRARCQLVLYLHERGFAVGDTEVFEPVSNLG
jgi:RNA polymerase sigma-70 factor (ECF subfamily)